MVEAFCETEELIGLQDLIQFNDLSMKVLSKINKQVKKK